MPQIKANHKHWKVNSISRACSLWLRVTSWRSDVASDLRRWAHAQERSNARTTANQLRAVLAECEHRGDDDVIQSVTTITVHFVEGSVGRRFSSSSFDVTHLVERWKRSVSRSLIEEPSQLVERYWLIWIINYKPFLNPCLVLIGWIGC